MVTPPPHPLTFLIWTKWEFLRVPENVSPYVSHACNQTLTPQPSTHIHFDSFFSKIHSPPPPTHLLTLVDKTRVPLQYLWVPTAWLWNVKFPCSHRGRHKTHTHTLQVVLSLPLQTDTLRRKKLDRRGGEGILGRVKLRAFFNSKSPLCRQGYRKHCSPSIYLHTTTASPTLLEHTHACARPHTHTPTPPYTHGERAPSSTLHWQRLKVNGPPPSLECHSRHKLNVSGKHWAGRWCSAAFYVQGPRRFHKAHFIHFEMHKH